MQLQFVQTWFVSTNISTLITVFQLVSPVWQFDNMTRKEGVRKTHTSYLYSYAQCKHAHADTHTHSAVTQPVCDGKITAGGVVINWPNGITVSPHYLPFSFSPLLLSSPQLTCNNWISKKRAQYIYDGMTSLSSFPPHRTFFPYFCLLQHFTVTSCVCACVFERHTQRERVCVWVCVLKGVNCFQGSFSACSHIFFQMRCVYVCVCMRASCQVFLSLWRIICLLLGGHRQVLSKQASPWTPLSLSLSKSTHICLL